MSSADAETPLTIAFKLAGPDQRETLLSLMHELYRFEGDRLDEAKAREALESYFADDTWARVWLVIHGEKVLGYAVLTFSFSMEYGGRDAIIDELYLRPAYRGQGFGSQAIAFLKATCRSEGIKALHLEVFDCNPAAYQFYRRHGFRERASKFMSLTL